MFSRKRLLIACAAAVLIAAGAAYLGLRKTVTLTMDGQSRSAQTFALTVGGFLQAEGITLHAADVVEPPVDSWLSANARVVVAPAKVVQLLADGRVATLFTASQTPLEWLAEAGLQLSTGDELWLDGALLNAAQPVEPLESYLIELRRAIPFSVLEGENQTSLRSASASTVGQALWQAGYRLAAADRVSPPLDAALTPGLQVAIQRARPITVTSQQQTVVFQSAASTVAEALQDGGFTLQGWDYPTPGEGAPLPADGRIQITHITEEVIIEQTPIPFETQSQADPNAELDTASVLQPGVEGIEAQRIRIRYADGVEITRTMEMTWVARAPQTHIAGYGTQIVQRSLDTADGPISYWRALPFWATAYAPKYVGGNTTTASGKQLRKGLVAVDVNYIPYGTMMYVPGYGFAEAADTGRITGRWIDLGYSDDDFQGWHQWVTVYFLWPPPGFIPWVIPPPGYY